MNEHWQAVCALLRSALFGLPLTLPDAFDWQETLKILHREGVAPLVSDVPEILPFVSEKISRYWKEIAVRQVYEYYALLTAENELTLTLHGADIPFVILKGLSAARYYPRPEYRASGDVDFLVPPAHFNAAKALLVQSGYLNANGDHPENRHFILHKDGVTYEMHRYFSPAGSGTQLKRLDARIQQAVSHAVTMNAAGCAIPCLPQAEEGLVILQHISQHLKSGLVLKQVLDWIMYVSQICDDTYWNATFSEAASANGLQTLAMTVARMGQLYLGLPTDDRTWCTNADDGLCHELMDQIMDSQSQADFAGNAVASALTRSRGLVNLFRNLQDCGKTNWASTLEKHPHLTPLAWFYQLCRYARLGFSRKQPLRSLPQDLKRAHARAKLYRRLGIE